MNLKAHLTNRQGFVVKRISEGAKNSTIATELGISEKTVEDYRQRAKNKTGCDCTAMLTRFALLTGLSSLNATL